MKPAEDTLPPALILLLDNKDSFVWNLYQAFEQLGARVTVARSDSIGLEEPRRFRALVLSPGPGRPEDAGISVAAVRRWSGHLPILGVCLGHQAIAAAFGATVVRGAPCHGRDWEVRHDGHGLFHGLPQPLRAARYHSLTVPPSDLPDCLQATAFTPEGVVMALQHRDHPTFGVQFHPESFRTPVGSQLLANFLAEAA